MMKKKISFLVLILLMAGLTVSAQIEKGNWFINGLNITSFQAGSTKYTDSYGSPKTDFTSFSIGPSLNASSPTIALSSMPSINYGITNKLSGGIFLSTNLISNKESNSNSTFSLFFIGPTVRYYFSEGKKFIPFGEAKVGFGSFKMGDGTSSTTNLSGWYLGTGATYFFVKRVGLDFTLGYGDLVAKQDASSSSGKSTSSFFNFGRGILVSF